MNRVLNAIAVKEKMIREKVANGELTAERLKQLAANLDMECDEYVKFQELKTLASQTGVLTLDEAQTIYAYLGNSPSSFNRQSCAVKAVLTLIFKELLEKKMAKPNGYAIQGSKPVQLTGQPLPHAVSSTKVDKTLRLPTVKKVAAPAAPAVPTFNGKRLPTAKR